MQSTLYKLQKSFTTCEGLLKDLHPSNLEQNCEDKLFYTIFYHFVSNNLPYVWDYSWRKLRGFSQDVQLGHRPSCVTSEVPYLLVSSIFVKKKRNFYVLVFNIFV